MKKKKLIVKTKELTTSMLNEKTKRLSEDLLIIRSPKTPKINPFLLTNNICTFFVKIFFCMKNTSNYV